MTTECVFLNNPQAGVWKIDVHAPRIVTDAHVQTLADDADFGLVLWDGGEERDQLVARADQALYRAKAKGASLFDGG